MKQRLISLLLCVVMIFGMIPMTALAAPSDDVTTYANGQYNVIFVKDAFTTTQIGVTPINGSSALSITSPVTLDGVSLTIGTGSMTVANLAAGYGLMQVESNSTTYYLDYATWGQNGTRFDSYTYEDIATHAGEGIYLHYREAQDIDIPVKAVDEDDQPISGAESSMSAGEITTEKAQQVVDGASQSYGFVNAELRPIDGEGDPVPITSVNVVNDYYYVTTEMSSLDRVTFDSTQWEVYLVYGLAYRLTVNVTNETGSADNQINRTTVQTDTYYYYIPRNGTLNLEFHSAADSNMTITNTTSGSDVLFSSAEDGYQVKTFDLAMVGNLASGSISSDQTINVNFTRIPTQLTLDYNHYKQYYDMEQSYHGFPVRVNNTVLQHNSTDNGIMNLVDDADADEHDIKINMGYRSKDGTSNTRFIVNTIVINGTALPLPTDWSWTGNSGSPFNKYVDFTIPDSDGNVIASGKVWFHIEYGSAGNMISEEGRCYAHVVFEELHNNIKIDRINLTPGPEENVFPDVVIQEIGEGITGRVYNSTEQTLIPGSALYPYQEAHLDTVVEFGYYITQFQLNDDDFLSESADTADNWYGNKNYYAENKSNAGPISSANADKIVAGGLNTGYLLSDKIDFTIRYDWDGYEGGTSYTDGTSFNLGLANSEEATPALSGDMNPSAADKVFVGWALAPTNGGDASAFYAPGSTIPRAAIIASASTAVTYSTTPGQATITVYPVFQDTISSTYADYTVYVHVGTAEHSFPFTGGIVGSTLDRDTVLALPQVANYVATLQDDYELDGGRSDSLMVLSTGRNEFDLYYNTTQDVTVTFHSEYGFNNGGTKDPTTEVQRSGRPGTVMAAPTPWQGSDVNATFVGWNTESTATTGNPMTNAVFPTESVTYYAIYVPYQTVTFYAWNPTDNTWSSQADVTVQLPQGTQIPSERRTEIEALQQEYPGYTWSGWATGGPQGEQVQVGDIMSETFSASVAYYAVYTPATNISYTLNANGGTLVDSDNPSVNGQGSYLFENQTSGSIISYEQPTRDGFIFAGWSETQTDIVGELTIRVPATSGTTFYAIWVQRSLTVTVNPTYTYTGSAIAPTPTVTYNGQAVGSDNYRVEYSANVNVGLVTVTVTGNTGTDYDSAVGITTFRIVPKTITDNMVDTVSDTQYTGSVIMPQPAVTDTDRPVGDQALHVGRDFLYSYGANTNVGSGTASVTVEGLGNYTGTVTKNFSITQATIVDDPTGSSSFTVNVVPDTGVYSGTAHNPTISVTYGALVLQQSTDYSVRITDSDGTDVSQNDPPGMINVDTYSIEITGMGNYTGSVTKQYTINSPAVGPSLSIDPISESFTYNGSVQTPSSLTVWANDGEGGRQQISDYTVSYSPVSPTNAGPVTVTVEGTGNYSGLRATTTYTIAAKSINDLSVRLTTIGNQTYTGSPITQNVVLTDTAIGSGTALVAYTDYTPQGWTNNTNVGMARQQLLGTGNYSGTREATFEIVQADIEGGGETGGNTQGIQVILAPTSGTFNNAPQNVTLMVTYGDLVLSESRDYDVRTVKRLNDSDPNGGSEPADINNIRDIGVYDITVTGKGNYSGTEVVTYTVYAVGEGGDGSTGGGSNLDVRIASGPFVYSGSEIRPSVTVMYGSEQLDENVDYTLTYDYNINAGLAVVTATGMSGTNFRGLVGTATFEIARKPIDGINFSFDSSIITNGTPYTGNAITLTDLVVKDTQVEPDRTLVSTTDYYVQYSNNTDVGMATATVTGIGNYQGSHSVNFEITQVSIGDGEDPAGAFSIRVNPNASPYTGREHTPAITVTYNGSVLAPSNYTLAYEGTSTTNMGDHQLINVGDYTITVTGVNNFTGSAQTTYTIQPADSSGVSTTLDVAAIDSQTYTGSEITPALTVTHDGTPLTLGRDYTVVWSANTNAGQAAVMVRGAANTNYAGMIGSQTFQIQPKTITNDMVEDVPNAPYTGIRILPEPAVTDSGRTAGEQALISGQDFIYTYPPGTENVNVGSGTASVTVTGRGNYTGSVTKNFSITQATIVDDPTGASGFTVSVIPSTGIYSGTAHEPTIVVTHGTLALDENTDYNVTITDEDGSNVEDNSPPGMINVGVYNITITGMGNYSGTVTRTYEIQSPAVGPSLSIDPITESFTYNGSVQTPSSLTVNANDGDGGSTPLAPSQYTVSYDPVNPTNAGWVTVTVTGTGNYDGLRATARYQIAAKSINDPTVQLTPIDPQTYTGSVIQPAITLTDTAINSGTVLALNSDFTQSSWTNNVNVGMATTDVTGMGNYTGTRQVSFNIVPADVTGGGDTDGNTDGITVQMIPPSAVFTGSVQTGYMLMVSHGNTLLTEDSDYDVAYAVQDGHGGTTPLNGPEDIIGVGVYELTVTGKGNYSGTEMVTYTVTTASSGGASGGSLAVTVAAGPHVYNGDALMPGVTVEYNGNPVPVENYSVRYDYNTNAGNAIVTVTGNNGTDHEGLQGMATFTISPKAISGTGYSYSGYSGSVEYTGSAITFPVTVQDIARSTQLMEGTDYYVQYQNNTNVGTASIIFRGIGNYTGSHTINFEIVRANIGDGDGSTNIGFAVNVAPASAAYNGAVHNPTITVTHNGAVLASSNYTVSYEGTSSTNQGDVQLMNVGQYTITVSGTGNYTGSATTTYTILPASSTGGGVLAIASIRNQTYTGSAIMPALTVTYNNGAPLNQGTDYTVTWSNNINAGTASVSVAGVANTNYDGMLGAATFMIERKNINSVDISVASIGDQPYTGYNITPNPTITDSGRSGVTLVNGVDYTLSYSANTEPGQVTVTINGYGNYTGSRTTTFEIVRASIDDGTGGNTPNTGFTVTLYPASAPYNNGNPVTPNVVVMHNGRPLIQNNDYNITYENASGSTVPNMIDIGNYNVVVTGTGNYEGTVKARFEITPAVSNALNVTVLSTHTYNGQLQQPSIRVTQGSVELQPSDYELQVVGTPTNAGVYPFIVNGAAGTNYVGATGQGTFTIQTRNISLVDNPSLTSYPFNGTAVTPAVSLVDSGVSGGPALVQGQDYTLSYTGNTSVGTAYAQVQGMGNYSGTTQYPFQITQVSIDPSDPSSSSISVVINPTQATYTGMRIDPAIVVTNTLTNTVLQNGTDYDVKYTFNEDSSDVTSSGMIAIGDYTITITAKGNYTGQVTEQFKILPETNPLVIAPITDVTYNGQAQTPTITVTHNDVPLNEDVDYTVTITNNVNAGTASVHVEGVPGTVYADMEADSTFRINSKDISNAADAEITIAAIPDQTFDGNAKEPPITITYTPAGVTAAPLTLTVDTDYYVTYANNISVGGATATIQGFGNYTGRREVTFNIVSGGTSAGLAVDPIANQNYTGSPIMPALSVYYVSGGSRIRLSQGTDYQVRYTNNIEPGLASVTVEGLGSNYGGLQANATFTIVATNLIVEVDPLVMGMSGNPTITVSLRNASGAAGTPLPSTAYSLAYVSVPDGTPAANLDAEGQYRITATGRGVYTGATGEALFLRSSAISGGGDFDLGGIALTNGNVLELEYNGTNQIGALSGLTVSSRTRALLTEGVDYELTISGNGQTDQPLAGFDMTNAGIYTVTITGINSYSGNSATLIVVMAGRNINNSTIDVVIPELNYNAMSQSVSATVTDSGISSGNVYELAQDIDYTLSAVSATDAGTYNVTVTGAGNYTGTRTEILTVNPAVITVTGNAQVVSGSTPDLSGITYSGILPEDISDVTVTLSVPSDLSVGTHPLIATLSGSKAGNYTVDMQATITVTGNTGGGGGGGTGGGGTGGGGTGGGGGGGTGGGSGYTITAEAGEGGTISPSGSVSVNRGGDQSFQITANEGYVIADVLVDGQSVGTVGQYTFEDVTANHTIEAVFEQGQGTGVADPDVTGVSSWLNTTDHDAYMSGYPDNTFGPNNNMTRAEAAQMFYNLLLDKNVETTVSFTDVASNAWYATAVNALASLGIVDGVGNNQFDPTRSITRAEFTVIATRFADMATGGVDIFSDVTENNWFYDYVATAVQYGWISGYPDGTFRPNNTITRAEVTTIVNRMLGRSADVEFVTDHAAELTQFTDVSSSHWAYYQIMEATNAHTYEKTGATEQWTQLMD